MKLAGRTAGGNLRVSLGSRSSQVDGRTGLRLSIDRLPSHEVTPLLIKLERFIPLACEEKEALGAAIGRSSIVGAGQILVHEGEPRDQVVLMLQGCACRYKMLACGRRQILGYLLPGDLCDVDLAESRRLDHSVAIISASKVARISVANLREIQVRYPNVRRAMSLASLLDQAILREWLLNVGQRSAVERLSHLICEIAVRLRAVGWANADGSINLPVNQAALADTIGLTHVHTNRTLQRLRSDGLIELRKHRLTILDPSRLAEVAGFEERYLQVTRYND